jgi:hypothetical protein
MNNVSERQLRVMAKVFNGSSRDAKKLLGEDFHELHRMAATKIKSLENELNKLKGEN